MTIDPIFAAIAEAQAAQRGFDNLCGRDADDATCERLYSTEAAVFSCPPRTLKGLHSKLEFIASFYREGRDRDEIHDCIIRLPDELSDLMSHIDRGQED